MRLLSLLLLSCLWAFMAAAQQSIEIKPGQMTFKGQGADLNDRLTSNANGVTNFKTKQEIMVIRNYYSPGSLQSFASGIATKLDFSFIYYEKRNNTTSNVNLTDDTILIEETGIYLIDVYINWQTPLAANILLRAMVGSSSSGAFEVRRTIEDPFYQQFTGTIKLTEGDKLYLQVAQTNSTNTTRSANFSVSMIKL